MGLQAGMERSLRLCLKVSFYIEIGLLKVSYFEKNWSPLSPLGDKKESPKSSASLPMEHVGVGFFSATVVALVHGEL